VIALAIILLFVGLAALQVLGIALRTIVASIDSMTIVRLVIVAIAPVALIVVAIFMTIMLLVAQFTAMRSRKMSRFLLVWLLLVLGNFLKNASRLIGCLTLLKENNKLERVSRHHLVQVRELELMCLRLRKEDLFTILLRRGYFHCLMEVATLEIAEKLYLMPHELVHQHESGFLGCMKSENQLVANIGKTDNSLEVTLDAFVKVCQCTICIVWTLLCNDAGPFGQTYVLKALTHEVKQ
jgi:hypothetical protein